MMYTVPFSNPNYSKFETLLMILESYSFAFQLLKSDDSKPSLD